LHQRRGDGEQDWIGSANLAVLRKEFDAVGGFDERLLTGENTELCQRHRNHGYRIHESKLLTAVHLEQREDRAGFLPEGTMARAGDARGTVRAGAIDKPTAMTRSTCASVPRQS